MNLPLRTRSMIGVDLAGRWMRAVQLSRGPGGLRLEAAARVARRGETAPADAAEIARFAEVLERAGFEPAPVAVAAPREQTLAAVLELPPRSSGAPVDQIARLELARANRCPPESLESGMWDVPAPVRGGDVTHAAVVALPREHADAIASAFDAAGMEVGVIDARSRALARAARTLRPDDGALGVLDVGWSAATLVVVLAGVPVFERAMDMLSVGRICKAAGDRLHVDPEAAWAAIAGAPGDWARAVSREVRSLVGESLEQSATELSRSMVFVGQRYPAASLRRLAVVGEGASLPGLCERAAEALGVTAATFCPAHRVRVRAEDGTAGEDASLAAAMGLALTGFEHPAREAA